MFDDIYQLSSEFKTVLSITGGIESLFKPLHTVRGKILEGGNFGEFGKWWAIRQNFPCQYL